MFANLEILKRNSIFLFIGSRELYFVRFVNGKIFSTRVYKISYNTENDNLKSFFKDYFIGKEGIPVAIIFDVPNQSFTEYKFLKAISATAIHHSIIKKISQDVPQEAVHDYYTISSSDAKSTENAYQVVSLVKTLNTSLYIDLLLKFPNPIAGYFSMTLEVLDICEGNVRKIHMPKPMPVIEQDILDIRDKTHDELTVVAQYSPISGVNFSLSQGTKILFHHHISCTQIDQATQKEINTTVFTIADYATQLALEYRVYVYGSESLLKAILKTSFDHTTIYYTQSELPNAKLFYHKGYSENLETVNTLDAIAFKCIYEPTFFIKNKQFFSTIFKHYAKKSTIILMALFIMCTFAYQTFMMTMSAVESFTKYRNKNALDVSHILNRVESLGRNIENQKKSVNFYSQFTTELYFSFFEQLKPLVKGTAYLKAVNYACSSECYGANAVIEITINGNAEQLQDYYSLVSDIRRVFYRYEITRKIDESTSDFTIKLTNQPNSKK